MHCGTIDVREGGVLFIEEQTEICAGQEDSIEFFAGDQGMSEGGELIVLVDGTPSTLSDSGIDFVDAVYFARLWRGEFCLRNEAEQS